MKKCQWKKSTIYGKKAKTSRVKLFTDDHLILTIYLDDIRSGLTFKRIFKGRSVSE